MTSPPARETSAATTGGDMLSFRKVTWPSAKTTLAPPGWKLKISSLVPQLLMSFQQPFGPSVPGELLLLLMIAKFGVFLLRNGSPETPKPLSCSAQRQKRRVVKVVPSTA